MKMLIAKIIERIIIYSAIIFLGFFFYKTDLLITKYAQKIERVEKTINKFKGNIGNVEKQTKILKKGLKVHGKIINKIIDN